MSTILDNIRRINWISVNCDFCLHALPEECDCEGYRETKYPTPYVDICYIDNNGEEQQINIVRDKNGKWVTED